MFASPGGSYAAGMERSRSVTNHLTLVSLPASRRSVARTCATLTVRCLKAVADSYVQASMYNPYWIGACPLQMSDEKEARQG